MLRLTVSGPAGSGTSTLVTGLRERFGWSSTNGGEIFRAEASRRAMSLEAFGALVAREPAVDRELDARLVALMSDTGGPEVVESRLAGWWAHLRGLPVLRVWLSAPPSVRAARVASREGSDPEVWAARAAVRDARDLDRYRRCYGLAPEDPTPYSLIIDVTSADASSVLDQVSVALEEAST